MQMLINQSQCSNCGCRYPSANQIAAFRVSCFQPIRIHGTCCCHGFHSNHSTGVSLPVLSQSACAIWVAILDVFALWRPPCWMTSLPVYPLWRLPCWWRWQKWWRWLHRLCTLYYYHPTKYYCNWLNSYWEKLNVKVFMDRQTDRQTDRRHLDDNTLRA